MRMIDDCRYHLVKLGISACDADDLRRISMTLHRWHEQECGDSNQYGSWAIVRGRKINDCTGGDKFVHDDNGDPYMERHNYRRAMTTKNNANVTHSRLPDREKGAQQRLAKIMAQYPSLIAYVQGDPRGCALYIIPKDKLPAGADVSSCYSSFGTAVHK